MHHGEQTNRKNYSKSHVILEVWHGMGPELDRSGSDRSRGRRFQFERVDNEETRHRAPAA